MSDRTFVKSNLTEQMITDTLDKNELLTAIDESVSQLLGLMSALEEKKLNTVPYKDSWTAGQLFRHVAKSTHLMAKVMGMEARLVERDAGERIPELKKTFLDFSHPLKSPDSIVPEEGPFEKQAILEELTHSFEQLKERASQANLSGQVDGLPLGPITKWELLHFVLYHTQRHLHQMKRICDALTHHSFP